MDTPDLIELMDRVQHPPRKAKFFRGGYGNLFNWHFAIGERVRGEGEMSWFLFAIDYGPDILRGRGRRFTLCLFGRYFELTWQWPKLHTMKVPRP